MNWNKKKEKRGEKPKRKYKKVTNHYNQEAGKNLRKLKKEKKIKKKVKSCIYVYRSKIYTLLCDKAKLAN